MKNELKYSISEEKASFLCKNDPNLGKIIEFIGEITITLKTNYYESLVKSIIGQQLSISAASTIWSRVTNLDVEINPKNINNIPEDRFRQAGVSKQKIAYIRDLNSKILNNELELDKLVLLSDQEVIDNLTKVKGIGNWTAEMFLIFSLGRLNILSYGDAGIRRAIKWLYSKEANDIMPKLFEKWSPFNSIASLYLWEIINRGIITQYKNSNELFLDILKT